jgi:uncharacterized protein (DUF1697 family)
MTRYLGLLRAINLAGHNKVGMADLRQLLEGLGFADVRSVLQSGNLIFESKGAPSSRLESLLEDAAASHLGLETDFFVRTAEEWARMVADNPFPGESRRDPAHLVVMLLKDVPGQDRFEALREAITGREVVRPGGRQAYIVYPDGIGRSKLTAALIEKKLGTRGTGRNWNTVLKLRSMAD